MYRALMHFTDLQDNNYKYQAGDVFPRKGLKVSDERLNELLSDKNRRHKPVIEKVEEPKEEIKPEEKPTEEVKKPAPAKKPASGRKKTNAK